MACYSHIRIGDNCDTYSVNIENCTKNEGCYILKIKKDREVPSYDKGGNCFSEFQN